MTGIPDIALYEIGRNIYDECRLKTGIPVTIGFSFTKTLAKVATDLGKKHNKQYFGNFGWLKAESAKVDPVS